MKKAIFILSVLACLMSCEKETLQNPSLQGDWAKFSQESPYQSLSFTSSMVEIQRNSAQPMHCQYLQKDNILLAKEISDTEFSRFAAIEGLNDQELKIRFLNTEVELRLDTTKVYVYSRNF